MTARPAGPDRYATSPARVLTVALAVIVTIALVIGTAAGPRAGLITFALAFGIPCCLAAALATLCLAVDATRSTRRRIRYRVVPPRVDLDVEVDAIEDQALTHLAHRLDQEA